MGPFSDSGRRFRILHELLARALEVGIKYIHIYIYAVCLGMPAWRECASRKHGLLHSREWNHSYTILQGG